jgi:transposase-like protein
MDLFSEYARSLSLDAVKAMSDAEAREAFQKIRWPDGKPHCPRCECDDLYVCNSGTEWKCKRCGYHFTVTSGSVFASRKMPLRTYLLAIVELLNGAKRTTATQLGEDLDVQYRTAWDLADRIRNLARGEG